MQLSSAATTEAPTWNSEGTYLLTALRTTLCRHKGLPSAYPPFRTGIIVVRTDTSADNES